MINKEAMRESERIEKVLRERRRENMAEFERQQDKQRKLRKPFHCTVCGRDSKKYPDRCMYCVQQNRWDSYGRDLALTEYSKFLPTRFMRHVKNNLVEKQKAVADYYTQIIVNAEEGSGLYLHGAVGSGKSFFACSLLWFMKYRFYIERGGLCTGYYTDVNELLTIVKDTYGAGDIGEVERIQLVKKLKSVDLLVLDDYGHTKDTQWKSTFIYELVNYRYNEMKSTIFVSNFPLDDLEEDERIVSRIQGVSTVAAYGTKDKRNRRKN